MLVNHLTLGWIRLFLGSRAAAGTPLCGIAIVMLFTGSYQSKFYSQSVRGSESLVNEPMRPALSDSVLAS